jgi:hypothetical protein
MEDHVIINLKAIKFHKNIAHHQGLIYARWFSFMDVTSTVFDSNEGVNDAALVYIDGPRFMRYINPKRKVLDKNGFMNNIFKVDRTS